jgi:prepilin-type N-terminal cleavage/methylation domain-containing protein
MTFHALQKRAWSGQRGLTLLELLVVLTILVVLSTVAITSTSGVADQARYEATQRTLENIREAVLGPANLRDTDGTLLVMGFVADTGRLPRGVENGADYTLAELWRNEYNLADYEVRQANVDNVEPDGEADEDVYLATGWRGPYLRLAPGAINVQDGWGVPFVLRTPNSDVVSADTDRIAEVHSFGANNINNGLDTGYDRDQPVVFPTFHYGAELSVSLEVRDSITGALIPVDAMKSYFFRLFEPDETTGEIKAQRLPALPAVTVELTTNPITFSDGFMTTSGLRAVRAYHSSGNPKSGVAMVKLKPGQNSVTLVIHQ